MLNVATIEENQLGGTMLSAGESEKSLLVDAGSPNPAGLLGLPQRKLPRRFIKEGKLGSVAIPVDCRIRGTLTLGS